MGNFESYTFTITSIPNTTTNTPKQKPVALKAINKTSNPDFVCPVVTYNDVFSADNYYCVVYALDFDLSANASQTFVAAGTLLNTNAATNFDIEAGTKGGRYCWMNCMTDYDYNGGAPLLNTLAMRLAAMDVDTDTVESVNLTPSGFSNITTNTYMFTSMWKYGILFAGLSGETALVDPADKSGSYASAKIPDLFGTMAIGSSNIATWLGMDTGTATNTAELTVSRSGTNPREVIANFEEVLIVDNNPSTPNIIINRITGTAGTTPTITNTSYTVSVAGSYFKMLAIFQHNSTLVIVGQTTSGGSDYGLLVIDLGGLNGTPTLTHQMDISLIASTSKTRGQIRLVYVGGSHTNSSATRQSGTAVGIVVDNSTSLDMFICDWDLGASGTLSSARTISGAGRDIEQVECAAVQADGTDLSYLMMYRDTATTIEFDYIDSTLTTWSNIETYTSTSANFSWAKSQDEQEFITMSEVYTSGTVNQDFAIHRYSLGTSAGGFPVFIS